MISTRRHGRITIYYWPTEERGKVYVLGGKKTVSQIADDLFKHIKRYARIPRAHLHLREFKDGYAIFDREGCRLYYGYQKSTGRNRWNRTAPFVSMETMHTVTGYDT